MKWSVFVVALGLLGRCQKSDPDAPKPRQISPAAVTTRSGPRAATDWIRELPSCDIEHEGVFLDVGAGSVDARRDHSMGPFTDVTLQEGTDGAFARVHTRRLAYEFSLFEKVARFTVSFRAQGVTSHWVSVYVDDRRLGVLALPRDAPGVVTTVPIDELAAGAHTVTFRFNGASLGADEPYANLDWVRLGPPPVEAGNDSYAAPTLRDVVTDVVLEGLPKRAIVLRSDSRVRCAMRVAAGMRFRTSLGYWGNGHGTARIRVIEDGSAPRTLVERTVSGGTGAAWSRVDADLVPYIGRVVGIELDALDSIGGGRVAFGEPETVSTPDAPWWSPPASIAVIIVAAGLDHRMVPPWSSPDGFPAISRLVRDGVAFDRYRAPTTVAGPVVASLLTGLSPHAQSFEDAMSRLPDDVRLIDERVKEGSAHAAFLTGVPTTFPAFGFDRGWDRYDADSPVKDIAASQPLSDGAAWIKQQVALDPSAKLLLVVHARGGHPPWDVTRDEVGTLPPAEYSGPLEPRAGAIVLANLRSQHYRRAADQRLSGDDFRRMRALEQTALKKQDAGILEIIQELDRDGLYDRALVVFMGDVGAGDPPGIPFAPVPPLHEDVLLSPLVVKFPGSALAGTEIDTPVTTIDVTATLLHALGSSTDGLDGADLFGIARGNLPLDGHPLVATLGARYATRWGSWLLSGDFGRRPTLCQIDVDPACASDVLADNPLAAAALWQKTYLAETSARARAAASGRKPILAGLDSDTQAALKVFGY